MTALPSIGHFCSPVVVKFLVLDGSSGRARPICACTRTNSMALKSTTTAPLSRRLGVPMSSPKCHRLKHRAALEPKGRWGAALHPCQRPGSRWGRGGPQKVDGDYGNLLPQAFTNIALPGSGVPPPAGAVPARHVGELFRSPPDSTRFCTPFGMRRHNVASQPLAAFSQHVYRPRLRKRGAAVGKLPSGAPSGRSYELDIPSQ
jgi:hypothetical protein